MAWLHATPKPDADSARGRNEATQAKVSRLDALKRDKITPPMPPNPAPHIVERLLEMGMSQAAGMGIAPLSWTEIVAWQAATMVRLPPWEARLIRRMSVAYIAESRAAESENCPPPWYDGPSQRAIETEQARLMAVLG